MGSRGGPRLVGWRYVGFVSGIVGIIGLAVYPAIIAPMRNPEPWKKISNEVRKSSGIDQSKIQPGDMKVWSDPFDRQGKPGNK